MSAAAGAGLKPAGDSWPIYRRLLKYAKPYLGVFLIGVLGAGLFAASNASLAYLVQKFLRGAFLVKNPAVLWEVPIGVVVLFTLRGIGDYVQSYFPSWVGRQVIKGLRHDVFSHYLRLPTAYLDRQQSGMLLSKLTNNIELVAAAATSAAISLISDSLTILALLVTLFYMNWRLRGVLHHRRSRHRLADADRQSQLPPLQRANPKFHGRYHARRQGGDRCAPLDQDLQCRGPSNRAVRTGQRTQPRLEHEADPRPGHQQSRRPVHRVHRARQRSLCRDTAGVHPRHAGRSVLRVFDRADADSVAAAQPGQHERTAAAGHCRGPERVRDPRSADRRQRRHARDRARARRHRVPQCLVRLWRRQGRCAARCELSRAFRRNRRHRRAVGQRQDDVGRPGAALLRCASWRRCCWTGSTCATTA